MTREARRQVLNRVELKKKRHPHAGLWLDKFLKEQVPQGGEGSFGRHLADVADIPIGSDYDAFFKRWKATLEAAGARLAVARTKGRLVVGLGAASVLENSITIHHTYGVPYIPGSALKGLVAHYAHSRLEDGRWHKGGDAHRILLGDTECAGYVTFFDALYIPKSAPQDRPLVVDVMTVHHPDYYRGEDSAPADWDSPTPISFVSARGDYLIALLGLDEWVEAAFQILALALEEAGIGAKTFSGYGRMELVGVPAASPTEEEAVKPEQAEPKPEPEPPLTWRRGTVRHYRPDKGFGRLVDDETGAELSFRREAIEEKGWSPGKKHKVRYAVVEQEGRLVVVKIRKA